MGITAFKWRQRRRHPRQVVMLLAIQGVVRLRRSPVQGIPVALDNPGGGSAHYG